MNLRILLDRIRRGHPTKFITLTARRYYCETPAGVYERHRPFVRRLVQYIRETFTDFQYCCITELHASGVPHWHIVARCGFVPQQSISRKWEELTGSKIVDIRKINSDRHAACYVAKYVTKMAGKGKPDWLKRVTQFSRKYAPKRKWFKPENCVWSLVHVSIEEAIEKLQARGFAVLTSELGFIVLPRNPSYPDDPVEVFDIPHSSYPP